MTQPIVSTALGAPGTDEKPPINWGKIAIFAGFHGLALLAPAFFSWSALAVAVGLHWLCGSIGICLGYHRLLSHRSLQVPKWLERLIATIGALALQGGPILWVSRPSPPPRPYRGHPSRSPRIIPRLLVEPHGLVVL